MMKLKGHDEFGDFVLHDDHFYRGQVEQQGWLTGRGIEEVDQRLGCQVELLGEEEREGRAGWGKRQDGQGEEEELPLAQEGPIVKTRAGEDLGGEKALQH